MPNVERTRVREREPAASNDYEVCFQSYLKRQDRSYNGVVVIDGEKQPWNNTRQGKVRFFQTTEVDRGTVLTDWNIFTYIIERHGGKHQHQGGLIIFVLEGEGYTVIDGERVDWAAGDMILLPIKPEGVEHQHFNTSADLPARWIAFHYGPYRNQIAFYVEQKEVAPDYRG